MTETKSEPIVEGPRNRATKRFGQKGRARQGGRTTSLNVPNYMKKYELVKYKYGIKPRYTAFCLTPACKPRLTELYGKSYTFTNLGVSSPHARHFQTPEAAKEWMAKNAIYADSSDWSLLDGTLVCPRADRR